MVTAQQACSTEMVKVAGNAYSVVTAQQACSTEMVKATYALGSTNSWTVALCAGMLVCLYRQTVLGSKSVTN